MLDDLIASPLEVLTSIDTVFRSLNVRYAVGGSFASGAHSVFRATQDIDVLADLAHKEASSSFAHDLVAKFMPEFFIDEVSVPELIFSNSTFNIIHRRTMLKVDIFPAIDAFSKEELMRAIFLSVQGAAQPIPIVSVEDIVIAKLRWYEIGGRVSERQWNDLRQLVQFNRETFDEEYITRWTKELGLEGLWVMLLSR